MKIDTLELRSLLYAILSSEVGWNVESRSFIVHEESVIDLAVKLSEELSRGAK